MITTAVTTDLASLAGDDRPWNGGSQFVRVAAMVRATTNGRGTW